MNILIVCIHYPIASGRFLLEAFRRIGHDARSAGPMTGTAIWGMDIDERYVWKPDFPLDGQSGFSLGNWRPDLIVTAESAMALKFAPGIPHVCYACDNHVRDYKFHDLPFDAIFVCHSWGARMGEPNVWWSPPSYEPRFCRDLGLERDIDIGVIAVPYQIRVDLIDQMKAAGAQIWATWGLVYEEYERAYNRVKISLIKSVAGDISHRVFETMAMGCCVLMDRAADMDRLGFIPWRHYVPYADAEEAVKNANYLLETGGWKTIAKAGQEAAKPHTWEERARFVLETLKKNGILN
jgi:spore maturation protein CgeB